MRAASYPSIPNEQAQRVMWALVFLSRVKPGNAGGLRAAFSLRVFGAGRTARRFHLRLDAIGGVHLAWPTSIAAHAADPGG